MNCYDESKHKQILRSAYAYAWAESGLCNGTPVLVSAPDFPNRSALLACVPGSLTIKTQTHCRDLLYLFPRMCLGYILSKSQKSGLYNNERDTQGATSVISNINITMHINYAHGVV